MAKKIRVLYTAPITVGFVVICIIVLLILRFMRCELAALVFSAPSAPWTDGAFNLTHPVDYLRLFLHVFAGENMQTFGLNAALVLALGPVLEARYGSPLFLIMMLACAFVSGVCSAALSPVPVCGGGGIVFLLIILYTFAYAKKEGVFFTNFLLLGIYLLSRLFPLFAENAPGFFENAASTALFAHAAGGLCASAFAFAADPVPARKKRQEHTETS